MREGLRYGTSRRTRFNTTRSLILTSRRTWGVCGVVLPGRDGAALRALFPDALIDPEKNSFLTPRGISVAKPTSKGTYAGARGCSMF